MLRVFKYDVPERRSVFTLDLPEGAQIFSAQLQRGLPQIWVLVDPDKPTETRHFVLTETGDWLNLPASRLKFVGTFLLEGGYYVLHLFEVVETM